MSHSRRGPSTVPVLGEAGLAPWVVGLVALSVALVPLGTVTLSGHPVVVSVVDVVNPAVLLLGVLARRRTGGPWRPRDPALGLQAAFLVLLAVQFVVPFVGESFDLEIATGASRFVGPAALLLGLTWLRSEQLGPQQWRWREAFTVLGVFLAVGIVIDVAFALGNPDVHGFYDYKRAIELPVGVSNIVAAYTALTFWPAVTLARENRRWAPPAGLILLATAVTLSRGAALGMAVAALVIIVGRHRPRWAVAGLAAVTIILAVLPLAMDTEAGATGKLSSALRVRDEQFTAAAEAWRDHPVLGVGLNRFQEDVVVHTSQPSAAAVDGVIPYEHPNNAWWLALAETGLVGTALTFGLWALLAGRILRLPDGPDKFAAAGAAAGLAVHAQLEALTFTRGIEVLFALLLAVSWTPREVTSGAE